ncbi:MAG: zinc ribbon domain-containing protein [Gemmatimonadaceae bacterium]|nr:zinc ribbon domain-containing protein [Gemmatimonadaceae bacterium]
MASARFCEQCGSPLSATARFCPNCGFSLTGAAPAVAGSSPAPVAGPRATTSLPAGLTPWVLPVVAIIAIVGYAIVSRPAAGTSPAVATGDGATILAPDISSLSPDERVDRLFNRIMSLASAGKDDSVAFFAPMAVNSFAALMPLNVHRRYDLGLVLLVSGETAGARAQADTILSSSPTHLLGLALAMRAANASGNTAEGKRLATKFTSVLAAERAKGLPEYADHAPDITDAIEEAAGRRKSAISRAK